MKDEKCDHDLMSDRLGYIAHAEWTDAMITAGLNQVQCPDCKLWIFETEMHQPKVEQPKGKK